MSIADLYHSWRKRTLPASKEDIAWRHSSITTQLDSIALALQGLNEVLRDQQRFENQGAVPPAAREDAQKLDRIAKDLQILKQKHNAFCSKSAPEMTLEILNAVLHGKVKFLQIGGNDGYLHDPVYKFIKAYDWEGVIVEPVPEYFEKLRRTYEDRPRVRCVNAAIDAAAGPREMYKVKADVVRAQLMKTGDNWLQGCACFSKDQLLRCGLAEDDIEAVSVEAIRGEDLVRNYDISDCDVLVIDVEGAEGVVFSSFDFGTWRPRIIIFESEAKSSEEIAAIETQLGAHGYEINWEPYNSVAVLAGELSARS